MLFLVDAQAKVVAALPVSIGGALDPLPVGKMKITNEVENPLFTYDPALIGSAKASDAKVDAQPGPNNPEGNMWLGLTKPHRGLVRRAASEVVTRPGSVPGAQGAVRTASANESRPPTEKADRGPPFLCPPRRRSLNVRRCGDDGP